MLWQQSRDDTTNTTDTAHYVTMCNIFLTMTNILLTLVANGFIDLKHRIPDYGYIIKHCNSFQTEHNVSKRLTTRFANVNTIAFVLVALVLNVKRLKEKHLKIKAVAISSVRIRTTN